MQPHIKMHECMYDWPSIHWSIHSWMVEQNLWNIQPEIMWYFPDIAMKWPQVISCLAPQQINRSQIRCHHKDHQGVSHRLLIIKPTAILPLKIGLWPSKKDFGQIFQPGNHHFFGGAFYVGSYFLWVIFGLSKIGDKKRSQPIFPPWPTSEPKKRLCAALVLLLPSIPRCCHPTKWHNPARVPTVEVPWVRRNQFTQLLFFAGRFPCVLAKDVEL